MRSLGLLVVLCGCGGPIDEGTYELEFEEKRNSCGDTDAPENTWRFDEAEDSWFLTIPSTGFTAVGYEEEGALEFHAVESTALATCIANARFEIQVLPKDDGEIEGRIDMDVAGYVGCAEESCFAAWSFEGTKK